VLQGGGLGGGGVDDDLAVLAHADAFGAYAGDILESEVDDAALTRGHGIETKGLLGGLDAFGGNAGGHTKFFKTEGAIAAAVEMNFFVIDGIEAQGAKGEMLEGFEHFGAVLEEKFFVPAVEIGDDFGIAAGVRSYGLDAYGELKTCSADNLFEKLAQVVGGGLPVQLTVVD
jgi:hypothetical protein